MNFDMSTPGGGGDDGGGGGGGVGGGVDGVSGTVLVPSVTNGVSAHHNHHHQVSRDLKLGADHNEYAYTSSLADWMVQARPPWDTPNDDGTAQNARVGLGTAHVPDANFIAQAIKEGVRHIDTARDYGTEKWVAQGIKLANVSRSSVFITSMCNGEPAVHIGATLAALDSEYVDLYLLHWPQQDEARRKLQWRQLEIIRSLGKARFVGVANADVPMLRQLIEEWDAKVDAVQCECNVYCQNRDVVEFCAGRGIPVIGYGAIAGNVWFRQLRVSYGRRSLPRMMKHPTVTEAASAARCTPAQVLISWGLRRGVLQIPKASTIERVRQNCASVDVQIPDSVERRLTSLLDRRRSTAITLDILYKRRRNAVLRTLTVMQNCVLVWLIRSAAYLMFFTVRRQNVRRAALAMRQVANDLQQSSSVARLAVPPQTIAAFSRAATVSLYRRHGHHAPMHDNITRPQGACVFPIHWFGAASNDVKSHFDALAKEASSDVRANALASLDACLRPAVANQLGMSSAAFLRSYIMTDARRIAGAGTQRVVHTDREYLYANDTQAFQLWIPIRMEEGNMNGDGILMASGSVADVAAGSRIPVELAFDFENDTIGMHNASDEDDRAALATWEAFGGDRNITLKPVNVSVGQCLAFNGGNLHCSDVGTTKNRVAITARYIRRENFVDLDALQMSDEPEEVLRLAQRLRVRNHGKPILHFHIPFETKRLDLSTSKFFKLLEMVEENEWRVDGSDVRQEERRRSRAGSSTSSYSHSAPNSPQKL